MLLNEPVAGTGATEGLVTVPSGNKNENTAVEMVTLVEL
jgi:hypothetical protein